MKKMVIIKIITKYLYKYHFFLKKIQTYSQLDDSFLLLYSCKGNGWKLGK